MSLNVKNAFADTSDGKGQFSVSFTGENLESGVNTRANGAIRIMTADPEDFTVPAAIIVEFQDGNRNAESAITKLEAMGFRRGKSGVSAIKEFNDIDRVPLTDQQHGQIFGTALDVVGVLRSERAISPKDSAAAVGALSGEMMNSAKGRLDTDPAKVSVGNRDINTYVQHTSISFRKPDDQYRFQLSLSGNASRAVERVNNDVHGDLNLTSMKVKPDMLLPTMELLQGKGLNVMRLGSEESVGVLA